MAEVLVGQPDLFRTEKQAYASGQQGCPNTVSAVLVEFEKRMLQRAISHGGGSHDQRTIGDRFRYGLELFRILQQPGSAHRRPGLAKCDDVWIHDTETMSAEIAHRASAGPNVQWVAWADKHHHQIVQL